MVGEWKVDGLRPRDDKNWTIWTVDNCVPAGKIKSSQPFSSVIMATKDRQTALASHGRQRSQRGTLKKKNSRTYTIIQGGPKSKL